MLEPRSPRHVAVPGLRICLASDWPGYVDTVLLRGARAGTLPSQATPTVALITVGAAITSHCKIKVMLGQSGIVMSVHLALLCRPTVRKRRRVMDVDRGEDAINSRDVIKAPDLELRPILGRTLCRMR